MVARFRHALLLVLLAALPLHAAAPASDAEGAAESAAEVAAPPAHAPMLPWSMAALGLHMPVSLVASHASMLSVTRRTDAVKPRSRMFAFPDSLRLMAPMRRLASDRWNTSDSSRPSDFALCYRVSRIMGLQIIPGDLTPSKLPTPKMLSVKTYGSGMGVMAGMTLRLGRTR